MSGIDYHALEHAIPHLDAILTAALHDRRVGWSDRAVYSAVCDAVAASEACYATQRIVLDMLRSELGIPDSIEDAKRVRTESPQCRTMSPSRDERGVSGIRTPLATAQGATAPIVREAA